MNFKPNEIAHAKQTSLNHEVFNDPVKYVSVVVVVPAVDAEIFHCLRCFIAM